MVSHRQQASDAAHQTELAALRHELHQLRMANEATTSQSYAAEAQVASQAQQQFLHLQEELVSERAKRQHAEKLWMEQMGNAQGSAMQTSARTTLLKSQLANRDDQVNRLGEQLSSMGDAIAQLKAQVEAWEEAAATEEAPMQSNFIDAATVASGVYTPTPVMPPIQTYPAIPAYSGLGLSE